MDRRTFVAGAGVSAFVAALAASGFTANAAESNGPSTEFSWEWLNAHARDLAKTPFDPASYQIAKELTDLYYDDYRQIRYNPDKAIWRGDKLNFQLHLFHLGYLFKEHVGIFTVDGNNAAKLDYDKSMFYFGHAEKRKPLPDKIDGFSGFRVHAQMENPGVFDEFLVFQGASYFRGRPKNADYGLSARGLALNTVQTGSPSTHSSTASALRARIASSARRWATS
jgi:glucans biosynthesis protein